MRKYPGDHFLVAWGTIQDTPPNNEVLEIALIVSLVLAAARGFQSRWLYVGGGVVTGVLLSVFLAVGFLVQANVLPELGAAVWDSSQILSEQSVVGQVLHALVGYISQLRFWKVFPRCSWDVNRRKDRKR